MIAPYQQKSCALLLLHIHPQSLISQNNLCAVASADASSSSNLIGSHIKSWLARCHMIGPYRLFIEYQ
jgi:hypothetical protein